MIDYSIMIEKHNKKFKEDKEKKEKKKKERNKPIKLGRVRLKGKNTDKYRKGSRPSIHSKIWRQLDENEKKQSRERRRKERLIEKEKELKRLEIIKNNKGRIKKVIIETELSESYKSLLMTGLVIINDLMLRIGMDYRNEEVDLYLKQIEKILVKKVIDKTKNTIREDN